MTIHLPKDVESSINARVLAGQFASADEAIAEAWREYIERRQRQPSSRPESSSGLGSIGAMHDDAELLEQITQGIMHSRETRKLRLPPDE
jgi:Arc/MetJ-type ribon-helix-helix transcriptional regulator